MARSVYGRRRRKTTMKKRKKRQPNVPKERPRMSPLRLVEGRNFRLNAKMGGRIDISAMGMEQIVTEWLKGRTAILVADGKDVVRIQSKAGS